MELKKLLMTSGKEGVCRRPGSPKMEGAGKKVVAGQLQVCGQKLLPQHPHLLVPASIATSSGSELTASCSASSAVQRFWLFWFFLLAWPDSPPHWSFHHSMLTSILPSATWSIHSLQHTRRLPARTVALWPSPAFSSPG